MILLYIRVVVEAGNLHFYSKLEIGTSTVKNKSDRYMWLVFTRLMYTNRRTEPIHLFRSFITQQGMTAQTLTNCSLLFSSISILFSLRSLKCLDMEKSQNSACESNKFHLIRLLLVDWYISTSTKKGNDSGNVFSDPISTQRDTE